MVQEVSEKEKEIQGKRDKFLQKLAIAIQEKNIDKINRMLKLLAYPPATCKAIKKAMLRNSMTRYLAVRMILDNNDDLKAMELPFLAELLTAIIGTLHINEYSKIHEDYHHIFVREA
jgi:hypothetical protein